MPCNFIASCFFLDSPWNRDPDCVQVAPQQQQQQQQHANNHNHTVDQQPVGNNNDADMATAQQQQQQAVAVGEDPQQQQQQQHKGPLTPKTVKTFRAYLPNCHRTYSCVHCRAHLANHDELISKSFQVSRTRGGGGGEASRSRNLGRRPCSCYCHIKSLIKELFLFLSG